MFGIANTAQYNGTVFLRMFLRIYQFSYYLRCYYSLAPLLKRDAETEGLMLCECAYTRVLRI